MKKLYLFLILVVMTFVLAGCGSMATTQPTQTTEKPVNYLEATKDYIHDELIKERSEYSTKIIERLFKDLEYEVIASEIDGEDAVVIMCVKNIHGGQAWIDASKSYAKLCMENIFSEEYLSSDELYVEYLDQLEKTFKKSDFTVTTIAVEMEFVKGRWVCDIDDDLINAVTGNLLAAMDGDYPPKSCFPKEECHTKPHERPPVSNVGATEPEIEMAPGIYEHVETDDFAFTITGWHYDPVFNWYTVTATIKNKLSNDIWVTMDDVSVNGYMNDPFWATEIAAGKIAEVEIDFYNPIKGNGIHNVEYKLRVYNYELDKFYYNELHSTDF